MRITVVCDNPVSCEIEKKLSRTEEKGKDFTQCKCILLLILVFDSFNGYMYDYWILNYLNFRCVCMIRIQQWYQSLVPLKESKSVEK